MKRPDTSVTVLTLLSIVLALVTSLAGLLFPELYEGNSVSITAQGHGQDLITAVIAVPAALVVLWLALRGSWKAQPALAGFLGYFLYTYALYVFAWKFNVLFLVYVAAFSVSLFGFILLMLRLTDGGSTFTAPKAPITAGVILLLLIAAALLFMWISQIVLAMQGKSVAIISDTDGHPVIQGLDLGVIVPTAALVAVMLLRGSKTALVWLSVLLVKGLTLGLAIVSMAVFMARAGVPDLGGAVIFIVMTILFAAVLVWTFSTLRKQ